MGGSARDIRGFFKFFSAITLVTFGWLAGQLGSVRLAHAHERGPADSIEARKGVEREWVRIIDQLKRGDWPGVVAGWTPSGVYVHPDYPDLVGHQQLQELFDKEVGPKLRLVNLARDVSHFIVDGDIALEGASSVEEWRTLGDTGKTQNPSGTCMSGSDSPTAAGGYCISSRHRHRRRRSAARQGEWSAPRQAHQGAPR